MFITEQNGPGANYKLHPRQSHRILTTATDDGKSVAFVEGRVYRLVDLNSTVREALFNRTYLAEHGVPGNAADLTTLLVETDEPPTAIAPADIVPSAPAAGAALQSSVLNAGGPSVKKEFANGGSLIISAPDPEAFAATIKALGIKPSALFGDTDEEGSTSSNANANANSTKEKDQAQQATSSSGSGSSTKR
jgi:hypothetical protein